MKSRLERIEKNEVNLEIEVPVEQVEAALDRAYKKILPRISLPGFRKGRVPRPVLESYYGKEILYEEALEELIPEALEHAVEENGIEPVSQPDLDVTQMEEGKPLIFSARIVVKPEVTLGQIEDIEATIPKVQITDADVENRLEAMRQRYARLVEIDPDSPAREQDVLTIDFKGYIDGEPFPGGEGEDYSLELGSGTFIPGFEEQLVGVKIGEEKEVKVSFPDDYHASELAGVEAVFKVNVKEAKRRELSPLDDDFAQEVSDFDTLEELRDDIRQTLEKVADERKKQFIREEVVKKAAESAEVDIPNEMINNQVDVMLGQFEEQLMYQGINLEGYLQATGSTLQAIREDFSEEAEQVVRNNLVLEQAAEQLDLEVTEEDMHEQMKKAADDFNLSVDEVKQRLAASGERIERALLLDKALDYMVEKAVVVEKEAVEEAAEETKPAE
jgi:trigger factor